MKIHVHFYTLNIKNNKVLMSQISLFLNEDGAVNSRKQIFVKYFKPNEC